MGEGSGRARRVEVVGMKRMWHRVKVEWWGVKSGVASVG